MLHTGQDLVIIIHISLDSAHHGFSIHRSQIRILSGSFHTTSPTGITADVHHRVIQPCQTVRTGFPQLRNGPSPPLRYSAVHLSLLLWGPQGSSTVRASPPGSSVTSIHRPLSSREHRPTGGITPYFLLHFSID